MLRQEVCNHLMAYKEEYIDFIGDNTLTKQQQSELFEHEVSDLRKEEHWISELSDATLLCIANIYQCIAKVYTSIIDMPIINLVHSIKVITKNQHSKLEYALLAEPGFEHYDACTHVAAYSTPVKNRPTQQERSLNDLEHSSPRKQAHYTSPGKKKVTRKKLLSPETWKKNIRRKAH